MRTRQEIVVYLLWMLDQHQCCGDYELEVDIKEEAEREGWEIPNLWEGR